MPVINPLVKTLRHYNLSQVKFLVGPPRRTTEWAKATLGPKATFDEYISRDVTPQLDEYTYPKIQFRDVKVVPHPSPELDSVRLAIPTDTFSAIRAQLDTKVAFADHTVQDENLDIVTGHTTFLVWLDWHGLTLDGDEYSGAVDLRAPDGTALSRKELTGQTGRAAVEGKLTLSYRGKVLDPKDWEAAPMSLKLSLRALWLTR